MEEEEEEEKKKEKEALPPIHSSLAPSPSLSLHPQHNCLYSFN
jgi:hypothetical protein